MRSWAEENIENMLIRFWTPLISTSNSKTNKVYRSLYQNLSFMTRPFHCLWKGTCPTPIAHKPPFCATRSLGAPDVGVYLSTDTELFLYMEFLTWFYIIVAQRPIYYMSQHLSRISFWLGLHVPKESGNPLIYVYQDMHTLCILTLGVNCIWWAMLALEFYTATKATIDFRIWDWRFQGNWISRDQYVWLLEHHGSLGTMFWAPIFLKTLCKNTSDSNFKTSIIGDFPFSKNVLGCWGVLWTHSFVEYPAHSGLVTLFVSDPFCWRYNCFWWPWYQVTWSPYHLHTSSILIFIWITYHTIVNND